MNALGIRSGLFQPPPRLPQPSGSPGAGGPNKASKQLDHLSHLGRGHRFRPAGSRVEAGGLENIVIDPRQAPETPDMSGPLPVPDGSQPLEIPL